MIALALLPLGIVAGALTTTSGFGGGLFLVVVLAALWNPLTALTLTSMALLFGNIHRVAMLRRHVDGKVSVPYILGALPGSFAGAMVVVALPEVAIRLLISAGVAVAILRACGVLRLRARARSLIPAGIGIGTFAATTGGGGLLQGPLFMATGLSGDAFVATMSAGAVALHVGRIAGYSHGGLVTPDLAALAVVLTSAIIVGNLLGRKIGRRLSSRARERVELLALVTCSALALIGLA